MTHAVPTTTQPPPPSDYLDLQDLHHGFPPPDGDASSEAGTRSAPAMVTPVRRVLEGKRRRLVTASIDDSVYSAVARMDRHGVGAILVHDDGQLVGIFTERDYLRRIILKGRQSLTTPIGDAMTTAVLTVTEEATVHECLLAMSRGRLRHLPVRRGRRIIGMLSMGDCVWQLLADQRHELRALRDYLGRRYPA